MSGGGNCSFPDDIDRSVDVAVGATEGELVGATEGEIVGGNEGAAVGLVIL